jgi:hypothetical protein
VLIQHPEEFQLRYSFFSLCNSSGVLTGLSTCRDIPLSWKTSLHWERICLCWSLVTLRWVTLRWSLTGDLHHRHLLRHLLRWRCLPIPWSSLTDWTTCAFQRYSLFVPSFSQTAVFSPVVWRSEKMRNVRGSFLGR